jgi:hypothetical protein
VEIFCRMAGTFKLMDECVSYCISFKCWLFLVIEMAAFCYLS